MARHHLLALRVSRTGLTGGDVILELERLEAGRNSLENRWQIPASELAALDTLSDDHSGAFELPAGILTPLADIVEEAAEDDEPLWLHLVKPYGALGALDWEASLRPKLRRAVLRLPDFLERPLENRRALNVALICDLPYDEPRFDVVGDVTRLALAMAKASPRPQTHVHVFTARTWSERIEQELGRAPTPDITVHQAPLSLGKDDTSWLRWIEGVMAGQALDLVHFLAHACLFEQRPSLALTESPVVSGSQPTTLFLSADRLVAALARTGAWACGFSVPPDAPGGIVRYFADTLAQTRPGPVLCHRLDQPASWPDLERWFRFLFSPSPDSPPAGAEGFAYCQPELVKGCKFVGAPESASPAMKSDDPAPGAVGVVPTAEEPAWVSAAQRFAETAALQSQRWTASDWTSSFTRASHEGGGGEGTFTRAEPEQDALPEASAEETVAVAAERPSAVAERDIAAQPASGAYEAAALDNTLRDLQQIVAAHLDSSRAGETEA